MRSPKLARCAAAAILPLCASGTSPARAAGEVPGPVQIGPSWGRGDPQHAAAQLSAAIANHGDVADRLVRVDCPGTGQASLRNATLHADVMVPTLDQARTAQAQERDPTAQQPPQQNGLDVPQRLHGTIRPVTALIDVAQTVQPVTDGALVPCSLYFARTGQRIVVFTIGETPTPTDEP